MAMSDDEIIASLARENVTLRAKVAELQDEAERRASWLWKAKQEFGVNDSVSFDDVWAKCLAAYKAQKKAELDHTNGCGANA